MPFVSFILRSAGNGSKLREAGAIDSALRGDGYIPPAVLTTGTGESLFSANVLNVNKVLTVANGREYYDYESTFLLEWELSEELGTAGVFPVGSPSPVEFVVVGSRYGEPITISDGTRVTTLSNLSFVNSAEYTASTSSNFETLSVLPGDWVYFSIFFLYQQTISGVPTQWYERLATLSVQVPFLHNSQESLWNKIPEYYRNLDSDYAADDSNFNTSTEYQQLLAQYNVNYVPHEGPLYRFTELFGWEIDRTRSLIDALITSKDPKISHSSTVDRLCKLMGVETDTQVLGTAKARALLDNIGFIRRRKGTIGAAIAYINALTGCSAKALNPYTIAIQTQRVNLIPNPKFVGAGFWGVSAEYPVRYSYSSASAGNPLIISSDVQSKVAVYTTTLSATSNNAVIYYMSMKVGNTSLYPSVVYQPQWGTGASFTAWGSTGASVAPIVVDNRRYYQMASPPGSAGNPVFLFSIPAGGTVELREWMVEPNQVGSYFDGSSFDGGYVRPVDPSSTGTADYRWGADLNNNFGSSYAKRNQEFSYYTLDYARVKEHVQKVVDEYIKPVGTTINLIWNTIP